MHDQRIIHGNLKGVCSSTCDHCSTHSLPSLKANILIDNDRHPRLIGTCLSKVTSCQSSMTSAAMLGGSSRWMSPELFDPTRIGKKESRPTRKSDCYALGMVIYEVLSGRIPFAENPEVIAILKILKGEHPEIPVGTRGIWFTADLYRMLVMCWHAQVNSRPGLDTVLRSLQDATRPPGPPYDVDGDMEVDTDPQSDATIYSD